MERRTCFVLFFAILFMWNELNLFFLINPFKMGNEVNKQCWSYQTLSLYPLILKSILQSLVVDRDVTSLLRIPRGCLVEAWKNQGTWSHAQKAVCWALRPLSFSFLLCSSYKTALNDDLSPRLETIGLLKWVSTWLRTLSNILICLLV